MVSLGGIDRTVRPPRTNGTTTGPASGTDPLSAVLSCALVVTTSATLAIVDPRLQHWFMLPVTACGALIAIDAVGWVRRRFDIFHPQAILGLLGVHFFYLAPILHVMLDRWPQNIPAPPDWREALATMACLNLVGLFIYRLVVGVRSGPATRHRSFTQFSAGAFQRIGLLAVAVSVAGFGVLLVRFGGASAYARIVTEDINRVELVGSGWLIIIAEAFPMIAFFLILVRWRTALANRRTPVLLLLAGLTVTQFLVAGLRGSRSNTIWPILISLILVHLLVLRISRKLLLLFVVLIAMYVYVYGLYKSAGLDVLDAARGTKTVGEVESRTGRDVPTLLLGDMARADVQALVLDRQFEGLAEPVHGITYLGDLAFLVPRSVLPERPRDKVAVGTDLTYGAGTYRWGIKSSKIYGITGEAVMNFGVVGGLASFALLGMVIRLLRRYYVRAQQDPALLPKLLAPLLWPLMYLPNCDLDNTLWFQLKYIAPLALVICLAALRKPNSTAGPARTAAAATPLPVAGHPGPR